MYNKTLTFNMQSLTNDYFGHFLGNSDYDSRPVSSVLTIQQGQETMCSNITIFDDIFIEANETFTVSLILESTNFSAGVILTPDSATVVILDNDGLYIRTMHC